VYGAVVCSYDAVSLFYLELYVKLSIYLSIYLASNGNCSSLSTTSSMNPGRPTATAQLKYSGCGASDRKSDPANCCISKGIRMCLTGDLLMGVDLWWLACDVGVVQAWAVCQQRSIIPHSSGYVSGLAGEVKAESGVQIC
jgi:hypothetical protein